MIVVTLLALWAESKNRFDAKGLAGEIFVIVSVCLSEVIVEGLGRLTGEQILIEHVQVDHVGHVLLVGVQVYSGLIRAALANIQIQGI